MKKSLLKIFEETELKSSDHNEKISATVLNELEKITKIPIWKNIPVGSISYTGILCHILLYPNAKEIQEILLFLLEKYHFNERSLLYLLLNYCNSQQLSPKVVEKAIQTFETLPYCLKLEGNRSHMKIETHFGTIEMLPYSNLLPNSDLKYQLTHHNFQGRCHEAVQLFSPYFQKSLITTSEMPDVFGGYFYHSYYVLNHNAGTVDITRNLFYPNHSFEQVYAPQVLLEYPSQELEKRFLQFMEQEEVENIYPVIQLALHQKRK